MWLLGYRDAAVEEDALPLFLLDREQPVPSGLRELMVSRQELLRDFAAWFMTLRPQLWEELRIMVTTSGSVIDWEAVARVADLDGAVRALPAERVIQILGIAEAVRVIGLQRVIEVVGLPAVIECVGLPHLIDALQSTLSPEQVQQLVTGLQQAPKP